MNTIEKITPDVRTRYRIIWVPSSSERFLCRSFKRTLARGGFGLERWKLLWDLPILLKVKCFV